jgi:hypothetical protein
VTKGDQKPGDQKVGETGGPLATGSKVGAKPKVGFPVPRARPAKVEPPAVEWAPSPFPYAPGNALRYLLLMLPYAWIFRVTILAERKGDITQVGGYQILQIAIVAVTLAVVVMSGRAVQMWQLCRGRPVAVLIYYYVFCLLTAVLSAFPQYSAYRCVEWLTLLFAIFIAMAQFKSFYEAEKAMIVFLCLTIIAIWINRGLLVGFTLSWSRWHTNDFTTTGAMMLCYGVGEYFGDNRGRRARLLICAAVGGFFLLLGTSTGSFIAAAVGLMAVAYFRRSVPLFVAGSFLAMVFVLLHMVGALQTQDVINVVAMGKSDTQHLESLSGRLPVWEYYFHNYVVKSPIIGNGLGALRDPVTHELEKTAPHASFLSALLYAGAVGMIFFVGFIYRCLIDGFWACRRRLPGAIGAIAAIAAGFVNAQTDPFLFDLFKDISATFCAFLALFTLFVVLPARRGEAERTARALPSLARPRPHADHLRRPLVP